MNTIAVRRALLRKLPAELVEQVLDAIKTHPPTPSAYAISGVLYRGEFASYKILEWWDPLRDSVFGDAPEEDLALLISLMDEGAFRAQAVFDLESRSFVVDRPFCCR